MTTQHAVPHLVILDAHSVIGDPYLTALATFEGAENLQVWIPGSTLRVVRG